MRALVTGGAGFIGSHLVDALVSLGHDVVVIDNESAELNERFYWNDAASNHRLDVVDYDSIRPLFNDINIVFHLAAESRLQPAMLNPIEAVTKNVVGTTVVLQCAKEASVGRIIYSSTSSGYGMNPPPNDESQPDDCLNPYSVSKVSAEKLCKMYTDLYGLETIVLRYFNVYGDRSPTGGQYAPVIGIFFSQYQNGKSLTVVGDGTQKRDFIHVSDVVRANIMFAEASLDSSSFGHVYNVASGDNISILTLAKHVSDDIVFIDKRAGEAETTLGNIEKIYNTIGWKPTINILDWVRERKGISACLDFL